MRSPPWLVIGTLATLVAVLLLPSCGRRRRIHSHILEEKRPFLVHLPPGYRESTTSYPVLYLLDAENRHSAFDGSFDRIAKRVDTMVLEGIPPMILVGVVNTHRSRDMLPIRTHVYPESGGAESFLAFLAEEMIPYVDRNFRTTGERILYGEADAGLFTLYALLERPEAFSAYIASSPTVGHCPDLLRIKVGQMFRKYPSLNKALFIIYADDDVSYAKEFIPALKRSIQAQAADGFRFGVNVVPGGGHVPKSSLHDGLRFYCSGQRGRPAETPLKGRGVSSAARPGPERATEKKEPATVDRSTLAW